METCPKCGAKKCKPSDSTAKYTWLCGSSLLFNGILYRSRDCMIDRIASLEAEVERLKAGYHDCLEDLICCGYQLDDYFQQKYGLDAAVKKHTEALEGAPHE
jgi:hypothetical protein